MKPSRQKTIDEYFSRMEKERLEQKESRNGQKVEKESPIGNKVVQLDISGSESQQAVMQKKEEGQKECPKPQIKQEPRRWNLEFYLNKRSSEPSGDLIENIHKKWWGNYARLEEHHGFIQWLFPNSFQSRFNRMASPLSMEEAKQFRDNIEIAKRYQTSYIMMLQFYGMKLKCKKTGQLVRARHPMHKEKAMITTNKPFFQERFYKTFLTSFHNHMRITRMLSSLVMCGFGRYAKEFSLFLSEEINQKGGALQELRRYGVYDREWKQYSQYIDKEEDRNILLKQYQKHVKV